MMLRRSLLCAASVRSSGRRLKVETATPARVAAFAFPSLFRGLETMDQRNSCITTAAWSHQNVAPPSNPQPDFEIAQRYIRALTGADATPVSFQTFDDRIADKHRRNLLSSVRIFHGTLRQHWPELTRLNAAGAGIFTTVNETDLAGRSAQNIKRVRAIFIDADSEQQTATAFRLTGEANHRPDIVVEIQPGEARLLLGRRRVPLDTFGLVQKALAERHFGSDPSVNDLSRVMRLPGTIHHKSAPALVKLLKPAAEVNGA